MDESTPLIDRPVHVQPSHGRSRADAHADPRYDEAVGRSGALDTQRVAGSRLVPDHELAVDRAVLEEAKDWIIAHQNKDGSFDPVGFVHHQEMMGGLMGNLALTAYVAIALMEAGERRGADEAVGYLEESLAEIDDAYTAAITTYTGLLAIMSLMYPGLQGGTGLNG